MEPRPARSPSIVWYRQDLRLDDHEPLTAALRRGGPVVPVYVWAPEDEGGWAPGAASRWWLHGSLAALDASLRERGSRLVLRRGPAAQALADLVRETGAKAVFYQRRWEPAARQQEEAVAAALAAVRARPHGLPGALLFEPEQIRTQAGSPYTVFSPFWRNCLDQRPLAQPLPAPDELPAPASWPDSLSLDALDLRPPAGRTDGWTGQWRPGEERAQQRLTWLLRHVLPGYADTRDEVDIHGTSRLSPHLHFGEISPRRVWHTVLAAHDFDRPGWLPEGPEEFLRQLVWREFAHHVLAARPDTPDHPLRDALASLPWRDDAAALVAWQQGRTGYPLVDAAMRELRQTGWLPNRARMVAASFLTKHLLVPWQAGARWFWDSLVDADLANNTLGWQWVAGCGADAIPFHRIFNPITQGEQWDPEGAYVARWVPELARLSPVWRHQPWAAPAAELAHAGVVLGETYPRPLVDHAVARRRALEAYRAARADPPGGSARRETN